MRQSPMPFPRSGNGDNVAAMDIPLRRAAIFLLLMVLPTGFACGGAPSRAVSSAASSTSTSTGGGAAERCLADADARRERKPSEPDRIRVKHVLVRYEGARGAPASVTRTREQACLRAEEALTKLKEGTSFGDVVALYSEESGAAAREGSIGTIERADVAATFADAAFELKVKEVSEVVETPFGFHLILRVE
jgi:NIMA-interacting peptidyl-prolyl cis-trans isomerase 1